MQECDGSVMLNEASMFSPCQAERSEASPLPLFVMLSEVKHPHWIPLQEWKKSIRAQSVSSVCSVCYGCMDSSLWLGMTEKSERNDIRLVRLNEAKHP